MRVFLVFRSTVRAHNGVDRWNAQSTMREGVDEFKLTFAVGRLNMNDPAILSPGRSCFFEYETAVTGRLLSIGTP